MWTRAGSQGWDIVYFPLLRLKGSYSGTFFQRALGESLEFTALGCRGQGFRGFTCRVFGVGKLISEGAGK